MKNRTSCPPAISFKLWDIAKRARQYKLISNYELMLVRFSRFYCSVESNTNEYVRLLELVMEHHQASKRKQAIKARLNKCKAF